MVRINGTACDAAGKTVRDYLLEQDYSLERVVVERNGRILPREDYGAVCFTDGDTVEIVQFVGGG